LCLLEKSVFVISFNPSQCVLVVDKQIVMVKGAVHCTAGAHCAELTICGIYGLPVGIYGTYRIILTQRRRGGAEWNSTVEWRRDFQHKVIFIGNCSVMRSFMVASLKIIRKL